MVVATVTLSTLLKKGKKFAGTKLIAIEDSKDAEGSCHICFDLVPQCA
jgi:hypothetical protein